MDIISPTFFSFDSVQELTWFVVEKSRLKVSAHTKYKVGFGLSCSEIIAFDFYGTGAGRHGHVRKGQVAVLDITVQELNVQK